MAEGAGLAPRRWLEEVIAENPDMIDRDILFYLRERDSHPERAETFHDLILALIPKEGACSATGAARANSARIRAASPRLRRQEHDCHP